VPQPVGDRRVSFEGQSATRPQKRFPASAISRRPREQPRDDTPTKVLFRLESSAKSLRRVIGMDKDLGAAYGDEAFRVRHPGDMKSAPTGGHVVGDLSERRCRRDDGMQQVVVRRVVCAGTADGDVPRAPACQ
jgi:hypothetical protein